MKAVSTHYKLLIVLLLISSSVFSQQWHYGAKIDLSLTTVSGKGLRAILTRGAQLGAFAQYKISKQWSIQPELLFVSYQVKKADDFTTYYNSGSNPSAVVNMPRYGFSLPVLLNYRLTDQFSILAGPQYRYYFFTNENLLLSGKDAFKKSEFGVTAGGQYDVGNVVFSLKFSKGVSDINNIDDRYAWRSNHIQLGVAVKIK